MKPVGKDKVNSHFRNKYAASIPSFLEAISKTRSNKRGLTFVQLPLSRRKAKTILIEIRRAENPSDPPWTSSSPERPQARLRPPTPVATPRSPSSISPTDGDDDGNAKPQHQKPVQAAKIPQRVAVNHTRDHPTHTLCHNPLKTSEPIYGKQIRTKGRGGTLWMDLPDEAKERTGEIPVLLRVRS